MRYGVRFRSSDESVVTVDQKGNVTGINRGTATITMTVTDPDGNSVDATCKVRVQYTLRQWLVKIILFGWLWGY